MRIYLEGGPFDGRVVELDSLESSSGLSIRSDGTLAGFRGSHPGTVGLNIWLGHQVCIPLGPGHEDRTYCYDRAIRVRDGASVYRMRGETP